MSVPQKLEKKSEETEVWDSCTVMTSCHRGQRETKHLGGEEVGRCGGGVFGGGGQLDGQLEGDVHLSFFSQRDNFRKLYDLEADEPIRRAVQSINK